MNNNEENIIVINNGENKEHNCINNSVNIDSDKERPNNILVKYKKKYCYGECSIKYMFIFLCISMITYGLIYIGLQIKNSNLNELTNSIKLVENKLDALDTLNDQLNNITTAVKKIDINKILNDADNLINLLKICLKPVEFKGTIDGIPMQSNVNQYNPSFNNEDYNNYQTRYKNNFTGNINFDV